MVSFLLVFFLLLFGFVYFFPLKSKTGDSQKKKDEKIFLNLFLLQSSLFLVFLLLHICSDLVFSFSQPELQNYLAILIAAVLSIQFTYFRNRLRNAVRKILIVLLTLFNIHLLSVICFFSFNYLSTEVSKKSYTETPYVLGHGGMGSNFKYPKNSEKSFQQLIALGCEGSEIDVQMTKDSVLVLYHDETLETLTNGTGRVSDHNWDEIKELRYFSPFGNDLRILKLEEFFQMTSNNPSFIFSLDIKFFGKDALKPSFYKTFSFQLKSILNRFHIENTAFIECKLEYPGFPEIIHGYFPSPNKIFITGYYDKETLLVEAEKFKSFGIGFSLNDANKNFIDKVRSKNLKIILWDVYTKKDIAKARELAPEYIQSDLLFFSN